MADTLKVLVTGTYVRSESHPNVLHRLIRMEEDSGITLTERTETPTISIDYEGRWTNITSLLRAIVSVSAGSARSMLHVVAGRNHDVLYVPYPSVGLLLLLKLLPQKLRPRRVVADVFISLYDTVVVDRALVRESGVVAMLIRTLERHAYLTPDVLVVDTPENAAYLSETLSLPTGRFAAVPLAIDERTFYAPMIQQADTSSPPLKILFVGTLVPLHGIEVLCSALLLVDRSVPIECTIVGDGQCRNHIIDLLDHLTQHDAPLTVRWIRQWQSSAQLKLQITECDLCVGILGNNAKSLRVWPFKNYLYMASGAALMTARTPVAMRMASLFPEPYFLTTHPGCAHSVAKTLETAARDQLGLTRLRNRARGAYEALLSAEQSQVLLKDSFFGSIATERGGRSAAQKDGGHQNFSEPPRR